jgi:hypothetical protein
MAAVCTRGCERGARAVGPCKRRRGGAGRQPGLWLCGAPVVVSLKIKERDETRTLFQYCGREEDRPVWMLRITAIGGLHAILYLRREYTARWAAVSSSLGSGKQGTWYTLQGRGAQGTLPVAGRLASER